MELKHKVILAVVVCASVAGIMINKELYIPPEALNPIMTQQVLCAKGFTTKLVRPDTSKTNKIKKDLLKSGSISDYQLDHRISLCAGGSPLNLSNLEMQPLEIAHKKDLVEKDICRKICSGDISLRKAQSILYNNWESYYKSNFSGFKNMGSILDITIDEDDE